MGVGISSVVARGVQDGFAPAFTGMEPVQILCEGLVLESPFVLIGQELINAYAEMSGDKNPIHLDPQFARACGLKGTIAQGALVFSRATGLAHSFECFARTGMRLREMNLKFKEPVYAGDEIRLRMQVARLQELRRGLIRVEAKATVLNQSGAVVQDQEWHGIYQSLPQGN